MIRTLRQSFRRRKKHTRQPESSQHPHWQSDEEAVRAAKCSFHVKYLGSIEVQESRGMPVCEQAVKQLKADLRKNHASRFFGRGRKKKIRAMLYVSPDALRVVEDSTKALLLDQTIEKVSFCAPDRNYERAFSYICRDGTTRRWLCHSFFAVKESGERLSHAVGCAFAACLEKKQKREKETGVTVTYDRNRTTFTREGSFRVLTLTEQQEKANKDEIATDPAQVQVEVHNPSAVPRPHAPLHLLRQASQRSIGNKKGIALNSPFKRNYSVQINKLPSTIDRQNKSIMNAVPEVEEALDISHLCSQISNTFNGNNGEDPFSKVPMPNLGSPINPRPSNGFNDMPKFTDPFLSDKGQTPALFPFNSGPSVHSTNPWAFDAQQQQSTFKGNGLGYGSQTHKRTHSEADKWLSNVEQQTGSFMSMQPFHSSVTNGNGADPFAWTKASGNQVSM